MKVEVKRPNAVGINHVELSDPDAEGMQVLSIDMELKYPDITEHSMFGGPERTERGLYLWDKESDSFSEVNLVSESPEEDEVVSDLVFLLHSSRYSATYLVMSEKVFCEKWGKAKIIWEKENAEV